MDFIFEAKFFCGLCGLGDPSSVGIAFIKGISLRIRNHETRISGDAGMLRRVKIGKYHLSCNR